jgi:hypothetical protein
LKKTTDISTIPGLKCKKPFIIQNMKKWIISPQSSLSEISTNEDYEKFCTIRDEMQKFLINLSYSGQSENVPDQIHYLYVALIHIENVEKEIVSSCFTEEMIYQNKILEDINCLKTMVLNYIRDLSDCIGYSSD